MWILGIELRASGRAALPFKPSLIFNLNFFIKYILIIFSPLFQLLPDSPPLLCTSFHPGKIPTGRRSKSKVPPLFKIQFEIGTCWEEENLVFSTTLQGKVNTQKNLSNTKYVPFFIRVDTILTLQI